MRATLAAVGMVALLGGVGFARDRRPSPPILEIQSDVSSTMPGSMFIPFKFWVPAGRVPLTYRFGGWDYYCASLEEAGASFPGRGSVVNAGDCVGVRRRQADGRLEWVVDNSNHNSLLAGKKMLTIWSRPVSQAEAGNLRFIEAP